MSKTVHHALTDPRKLIDDMILNTCAGHVYKDDSGREVSVYKYDCHCVEYEVHVVHGEFPDYEIVKVSTQVI